MTITHAELINLYRYDPETGLLYGKRKETPVGSLNTEGYVKVKIRNKLYSLHRLAWFYVTGEWPKNIIDHKNRVKYDNRFSNLRDVTHIENLVTRSVVSPYFEIYPHRGKTYLELVKEAGWFS